MDSKEHDDYVGTYAIKGQKITLDNITKHFYAATIVPIGVSYYSDDMHENCFLTAKAIKSAFGGNMVYAFLCSLDEEQKGLELMPHGIVIKDGKIVDPISNHLNPDKEQFYLLPKKVKKGTILYGETMKLTHNDLYSLFPQMVKQIL